MAVTVAHTTQSATPDSGDGKISSDAWNEDHTIAGLGTAAESDTTDFAAAVHGHVIANVTGLQTALDGKLTVINGSGGFAGYLEHATETGIYLNSAGGTKFSIDVAQDVGSIYAENNGASQYFSVGGSLNGSSRFALDSTHAFEFTLTPYVGANAIYHAGNLSLGYFATGTDAANLTGTVAAARIADGSLSIAKTSGLQTALDGKLAATAGAAPYTAAYTKLATDGGFYTESAGGASAAFDTTATVGAFYAQNSDGTKYVFLGGDLNANSRVPFDTGNALQFNDTPYVIANVMYHAGNLTFSGDVSNSGLAVTIANGAVSLAKMANMATASLIYRKTAGAGAPEVNTLATLKTDLGLTGTNSGDQTFTLTGDVTGTGTGSFATTIGAGKVTRAMMANTAAATVLGSTAAGAVAELTAAQAKTFLAIAESDVTNLTTDLAAKASLASPQFTGVAYYQQSAPTARNSTTTLTIADLLTLIITSTSASAVSLTLPTGTLTDAGILSGALGTNEAFEWYVINLGSSSGAVTILAGTAHTIVGNAVVAISTSARFLTRKTATNTFVTYRIA